MPGPEETRLIQALEGARPGKAAGGASDWELCAGLLEKVSSSLALAQMPIQPGDAGADTAAAITASFHRSAEAMKERAIKLREGTTALTDASGAIVTADAEHVKLGTEGDYPTYTPHADPGSTAGIKKHNAYLAEVEVWDTKRKHREKISREQNAKLETEFKKASATMKTIHGIPDPPPPPKGYDDGNIGGNAGRGGGNTPPRHALSPSFSHVDDPTFEEIRPTPDNTDTTPIGDGHDPDNGTDDTTGAPQDTTPVGPGTVVGEPTSPTTTAPGTSGGVSGSTGLGLSGAAAGGIGGGMLGAGLAGGIRGGVAPIATGGGTASSGVRGIGATSRSGASGTLGRSSGVGAGSGAGRSTGARTGASAAGRGAGAGGRGGGTRGAGGSRGGAGARGAAAGAGGRSGRSKDDEKNGRHDEFDIDEDWIDDEDIAPGVIN